MCETMLTSSWLVGRCSSVYSVCVFSNVEALFPPQSRVLTRLWLNQPTTLSQYLRVKLIPYPSWRRRPSARPKVSMRTTARKGP